MLVSDWNSTGISQRFIHELQLYFSTNNHIRKVVLFGSRARGDHQRTSDIDLAIFTSNISHNKQNLIELTIDEMSTPLKINVVFTDRLTKDRLIISIIKDGVVIYEQEEAI
jgi:uncharacterized protein